MTSLRPRWSPNKLCYVLPSPAGKPASCYLLLTVIARASVPSVHQEIGEEMIFLDIYYCSDTVGATGDGRGWARMGAGGGRRWTQVLELVIIALVERRRKNKKTTTYLINWASAWLSVDGRGGGSGR